MKCNKQKKNICRRAGFSLSETLLAVLLLSIIFLAATVGVRALYNAYQKITVQAEAQVLLSTAVSEITNDIHGVTQVKKASINPADPSEGSTYQFFTTSRNTFISYGNPDPTQTDEAGIVGIMVVSGGGQKIALLPDAANTQNLYTKIENVSFDDGIFYCKVSVIRDGKVYDYTELYIRPYSRNLIVTIVS